MMDFVHYYQSELTYLRDVGRAFAEKHPALAGMLAERGGDPDVERLLEGFAFVAARFRQRVDDSVPELVEALAELLVPQLLRTTPATTIVQFRSTGPSARGVLSLPGGARLASEPVRGTPCHFRTTRPVHILPLTAHGARCDDLATTSPTLTFSFSVAEGARQAVFRAEGLRFHIHAEAPVGSQLYLWIAQHLASVCIRTSAGASVELGARSVELVGLDHGDALVPWPAFAPAGPRVLLEYFTCPDKFLFFDVLGLDRAALLEASEYELCLRFTKPPALPARLPQDALRLHCVPAVNLFEASADPVRTTSSGRRVLLRAQGIDPQHAEVYDVSSVTGLSAERRERRTYDKFQAFKQALPGAEHDGFYTLTREPSPVDDGLHTYLALGACRGRVPSLVDETLSIELLATNRSLPSGLQVGDLCVPTADTPAGVAFTNIARVSRPVRPALGNDLVWRFVSQLACARRSLGDAEALRAMLLTYNRQDGVDFPSAAANRARIDAIRSVVARPITRAHRAAAVRGTLYSLELDRHAFTCEGDAYLFGAVLQRFFALGTSLNSFADLHITLTPSGQVYRYRSDLEAPC